MKTKIIDSSSYFIPVQPVTVIPKPTTRTPTTTAILTTTPMWTSHADEPVPEPTSDVINTPTPVRTATTHATKTDAKGTPNPQNGGLSTGISKSFIISQIAL